MGENDKSAKLQKMRQKMAWLLAQADEYDTGRPEMHVENGIVASRRCAEMAAVYRRQANNLATIIAAAEEA